MTVYFILLEAINGNTTWNPYCGVRPSYTEALDEAESIWHYLTRSEKSKRVLSINHADVPLGTPMDEAYSLICESGSGWYEDKVIVASD